MTGYPRSIVFSKDLKEFSIPCFRCGECCSRFRVVIEENEARRIADGLQLNYGDFLANYTDPKWHQTDNFLLRRNNGECIFLDRQRRRQEAVCGINQFKPVACRLWIPSVFRPECRDGLEKFWQLKVDESGGISGTPKALDEFYCHLKSLVSDGA